MFHELPAKMSRVGASLKFMSVPNKPGPRVLLGLMGFCSWNRGAGGGKAVGLLQRAELSLPVLPVLPALGSEGPSSSQLAQCRYRKFHIKSRLILLGRKRRLFNAACSNREYSPQPLKSFMQNTASFFLRVFFLPRNKKHPLSV